MTPYRDPCDPSYHGCAMPMLGKHPPAPDEEECPAECGADAKRQACGCWVCELCGHVVRCRQHAKEDET